MADAWTIEWRGQSWGVTSFQVRSKALSHTEDHYLAEAERWEQVDAAAERMRRELRAAGNDGGKRAAVIDSACVRYEDAIRRLTGKGRIEEARVRRYEAYQSLMIRTDQGLFATFGEKSSDLRTAYRPVPTVVRGVLSVQNFRDNARRKIASF